MFGQCSQTQAQTHTNRRRTSSWNHFQCDVTQGDIEAQIDALVRPREGGISLHNLGYDHLGLDDCWQLCRSAHDFHNPVTGRPQVNTSRFPDLAAMVQYGRAKNVTVGFCATAAQPRNSNRVPHHTWWCENRHALSLCWADLNNCHCAEDQPTDTHYEQDVALTVASGFGGLKVDSCGSQSDMLAWAGLLEARAPHDMLLESCGNGPSGTDPKHDVQPLPAWEDMLKSSCPFSFYRVSP